MSSLTVHLRGMSGTATLELPEDSSVADVRAAAAEAGIDTEGLSIRTDGSPVGDESQSVRDEQVFVTAPPAAKHGLR